MSDHHQMIREALEDLVEALEKSNATDDHGHDLKNLAALSEARELLKRCQHCHLGTPKTMPHVEGLWHRMPSGDYMLCRAPRQKQGAPEETLPDLYILFGGPPAPKSGRFVDVVDADGKGIETRVEWKERADGLESTERSDLEKRRGTAEADP